MKGRKEADALAGAKFICHKDFEDSEPINVFHKEELAGNIPQVPEHLKNRHILFRKNVDFGGKAPVNALIRITADDYFKLYINGKFVTMGPAASYPQKYNYMTVPITDFVSAGFNSFAIHTYCQGYRNRVWVSGDNREMMWCEIEADGKTVCVSDETWKVSNHTGYTGIGVVGYETQVLECFDSGAKEAKFYEKDFDDSSWEYARIKKHADYVLCEQTTKPLEIYDVSPEKIEKTGNIVRLDFGREMVGYITANAIGPKGATILIRAGEELNGDGSVRFKMRCGMSYDEKWILSGGKDTLMQFDYKAFRYAEIVLPEDGETGADEIELTDIRMIVRHYPFEEKAVYKTKKPVLRDVIKLCVDTAKYATQENYVDCPTREKGQYLGDVSIAGRAQAVASQDYTMIKKAIRDFAESAFICKGIMTISNGALMQEIADYSLQYPAQILWVYKMEGDINFVRELEPYITGCLEHFKQFMRDDGLIEDVTDKWNLVDWPANLRDGYDFPLTKPIGPGVHNVINAFWIGFLEAVDELNELLGKEKTGLVDKAKESFIKAFYNEKTGLFCDSVAKTHSSIHSNILPLLFDIGLTPEKAEIGGLEARIVKFIVEKKLSSMGVYMAYFALAGLAKHGYMAEAEELATDDGAWPLMLKEGATTTFEAWGKDQKWNTSLCHPWASAPAIIFAENVIIY